MITEWLVSSGLAQNRFAAGYIYNGLKLQGLLTEAEQKARCELYRKWRPKTDKKDMLPTWQAYELAIAGIDPDNVAERQIYMFEVNNE